MRRCLVGFLWLLGLWLGTLVAAGAVAGMVAASQARTCQPTPAADFAHGFEVGQRAGNAFRERHGAAILLGALIVAIGGTSLGVLPGTRPRAERRGGRNPLHGASRRVAETSATPAPALATRRFGLREWSYDWAGVPIRVRNWNRGLRTGEELWVGGTMVDASESWACSRLSAHLVARVSRAGSAHVIDAFIGQARGRVTLGCHILLEGTPVGGDLDRELLVVDVARVVADEPPPSIGRDMLSGVIRFGVPYAWYALGFAGVWAVTGRVLPWSVVAGVLFGGVPVGPVMGVLARRSRAAMSAARRTKLRAPPRAAVLEPPSTIPT